MSDSAKQYAFELYATSALAEAAVRALHETGFALSSITALHPDNGDSRDFAKRNGTLVPQGTGSGRTAGLPLEGERGVEFPAEGPVAGALDGAAEAMGVPNDSAQEVLSGKVLVSVECADESLATQAAAVLTRVSAVDVAQ